MRLAVARSPFADTCGMRVKTQLTREAGLGKTLTMTGCDGLDGFTCGDLPTEDRSLRSPRSWRPLLQTIQDACLQ